MPRIRIYQITQYIGEGLKILALVKHGYGESGGIARYTQDLLNALRESSQQIELSVLAQTTHVVSDFQIPDEMSYLRIDSKKKLSFIIASLKLLLNERFDYLVCAHLYLLPIACLFKIFRKTKIIVVIYGIEAWKPKNYLFCLYVRLIDRILSISNFTREKFLVWSGLQREIIFILAPAIDEKNFLPSSEVENLRGRYGLKDKSVILTVGRLQSGRSKGHDILIDSLPSLIKSWPNLVYLIIGDGDDKVRLEQKVESLGLKNKVLFLGFVKDREKSVCYHLADVFFMAGEGEGFGIVYLEALACGCSVVASKLDASVEVLSSLNSGILIDPRSQEEVKNAVSRALRLKKIVPAELSKYSFKSFNRQLEFFLTDLKK